MLLLLLLLFCLLFRSSCGWLLFGFFSAWPVSARWLWHNQHQASPPAACSLNSIHSAPPNPHLLEAPPLPPPPLPLRFLPFSRPTFLPSPSPGGPRSISRSMLLSPLPPPPLLSYVPVYVWVTEPTPQPAPFLCLGLSPPSQP
ncbi:unnamed protein product, partial [Laminaria digitata]